MGAPEALSARTVRAGLCLLLIAAGARVPARAESSSGAQILMLDLGARSAALGGAVTALSEDANAVFSNPAGLIQLERPEATLMQNMWLDGFRLYYMAAGRRFGNRWAAGAGLVSVDYGTFEKVDRYGTTQAGEEYTAGDWLGVMSAAGRVGDQFVLGGSVKFLRQRIEDESAQAVAGDWGLLWQLPRFQFGMATQNMGQGVRFRQERSPLPLTIRWGAAFSPWRRLVASADLVKTRQTNPNVRLGAEFRMGDALGAAVALRGGFTTRSGPAGGITAGLGLTGKRWEIAYAYKPYGDFQTGHWFGISLRGQTPREIFERGMEESWADRMKKMEERHAVGIDDKGPQSPAARMYQHVFQWYRKISAEGSLTRAQRMAILHRIITRYEGMGLWIPDARTELRRLEEEGRRAGETSPLDQPDPIGDEYLREIDTLMDPEKSR